MSKASNASAMMQTAQIWKEQSHCVRLKVGAVLAANGKIISHGYNGTPRGFRYNCDEIFKFGNGKFYINFGKIDKLHFTFSKGFGAELMKYDGFMEVSEEDWRNAHHEFSDVYEVHAEPNAILSAFTDGTNYSPSDMVLFVTTAPCEMCCKLIGQCGIKTVVYSDCYDRFGIENIESILANFDVKIYRIDDYIEMLKKLK